MTTLSPGLRRRLRQTLGGSPSAGYAPGMSLQDCIAALPNYYVPPRRIHGVQDHPIKVGGKVAARLIQHDGVLMLRFSQDAIKQVRMDTLAQEITTLTASRLRAKPRRPRKAPAR
jgi:hypothetical protein